MIICKPYIEHYHKTKSFGLFTVLKNFQSLLEISWSIWAARVWTVCTAFNVLTVIIGIEFWLSRYENRWKLDFRTDPTVYNSTGFDLEWDTGIGRKLQQDAEKHNKRV